MSPRPQSPLISAFSYLFQLVASQRLVGSQPQTYQESRWPGETDFPSPLLTSIGRATIARVQMYQEGVGSLWEHPSLHFCRNSWTEPPRIYQEQGWTLCGPSWEESQPLEKGSGHGGNTPAGKKEHLGGLKSTLSFQYHTLDWYIWLRCCYSCPVDEMSQLLSCWRDRRLGKLCLLPKHL